LKKHISLILAGAVALTVTACGTEGTPSTSDNGANVQSGGEVNVYNWGEYIDESIFDDFTAQTGIQVNYQTYDANESLYSKLAAGSAGYDVIIPSDYMIGQMIEEEMLEPLNFDNIPNFSDIDPALKNPAYDPENRYSVPYMTGTLGIIYNTTLVDANEDMETWDVLWNEKYAGDILMFNNSRDAIGIALKKLGYSYNTTDVSQISAAVDELIVQAPLLQGYYMDEQFGKLEGSNAAIGVYYYGDFLTMKENNPDLAFAVPREGTNLYVDAMCIPKGCENKENAEAFINFMCSTEVGLANVEATWYSTPLRSVRAALDPEISGDSYAYPNAEFVNSQCETYACLPSEIRTLYNTEWARLLNA